MSETDSGRGSWLAYGAAGWAIIFAALHIMWAAGWYIGLQAEQARKAFGQRWFLAYDLVVAALCVLAVPVALALVRPWGRRLPRWSIGLLAWGGTALLVLRSGASIIQIVYMASKGTSVTRPMHLWELWFCVGAMLFGVSTWNFWAAEPRSFPASRTHVAPSRPAPRNIGI